MRTTRCGRSVFLLCVQPNIHTSTTEAQGATLRPSTCPEHLNNATYAVCSFADALIAHWAQLHGVEVVSWLYVLDCLAQRRRLATDHVVRGWVGIFLGGSVV